ncbi:Protein PUTATIVE RECOMBINATION INITIATION DEFECT 1 [Linum grandiflorum]
MSPLFPDPSKAEESFSSLNQMKDRNISNEVDEENLLGMLETFHIILVHDSDNQAKDAGADLPIDPVDLLFLLGQNSGDALLSCCESAVLLILHTSSLYNDRAIDILSRYSYERFNFASGKMQPVCLALWDYSDFELENNCRVGIIRRQLCCRNSCILIITACQRRGQMEDVLLILHLMKSVVETAPASQMNYLNGIGNALRTLLYSNLHSPSAHTFTAAQILMSNVLCYVKPEALCDDDDTWLAVTVKRAQKDPIWQVMKKHHMLEKT